MLAASFGFTGGILKESSILVLLTPTEDRYIRYTPIWCVVGGVVTTFVVGFPEAALVLVERGGAFLLGTLAMYRDCTVRTNMVMPEHM